MNKKVLVSLVWKLFYLLVFLSCMRIVSDLFGVSLEVRSTVFRVIFLSLPVIMIFFHACAMLSPKRAIGLFLLASAVGFVSEYLGLRYGSLFGMPYFYKPQFTLFTVPIQILFYWAVFIYLGISITNIIFKSPSFIAAMLSDALSVLAIDLFMDPLEVKLGMWSWPLGGFYFGVPLGNFVGWFIVVSLTSFIFRLYADRFPIKRRLHSVQFGAIPIFSYLLLLLALISMSIQLKLYAVGVLGTLFMLPFVVISFRQLLSRGLFQK